MTDEARTVETPAFGPRTVLIIEDDRDLRQALAASLRDEGYDVAVVTNGLEGFAWLRSHPLPSVILLDLMMPAMNGWQFRSRQQRDPAIADIPVIVMTAADGENEASATRMGTEFIGKPFAIDRLLALVGRYAG